VLQPHSDKAERGPTGHEGSVHGNPVAWDEAQLSVELVSCIVFDPEINIRAPVPASAVTCL